MSHWVDQNGAILADSVYCDGKLVARDVAFTLPAITFLTEELKAMGTMTRPIYSQIESMEATITHIGIDLGLTKLTTPGNHSLEFRWAANKLKANGTSVKVAHRAYITGQPLSIPGPGITVGEIGENEVTYSCTRYRRTMDGKETLLIDRLSVICKIDGTDSTADIAKYL